MKIDINRVNLTPLALTYLIKLGRVRSIDLPPSIQPPVSDSPAHCTHVLPVQNCKVTWNFKVILSTYTKCYFCKLLKAKVRLFYQEYTNHTIRKCQKMARQNTFQILLLNGANMIGEHWKTRMKMQNMCPFEKRHFLTWNDLNPRLGKHWDTVLRKFTNGTLKTLQM